MKYKVGDEVLIKGKIAEVDSNDVNYPYSVVIKDGEEGWSAWIKEQNLIPVTAKVKVPAWFDEWYRWFQESGHEMLDAIKVIVTVDHLYGEDNQPHSLTSASRELFTDAILHGYEVEKEKRYRIPLPNLKTSDGYQQYLSRKSKRNGHWFASRRQSNLIQAFTKAEIEQVPEAYRQYAVEVEADENN